MAVSGGRISLNIQTAEKARTDAIKLFFLGAFLRGFCFLARSRFGWLGLFAAACRAAAGVSFTSTEVQGGRLVGTVRGHLSYGHHWFVSFWFGFHSFAAIEYLSYLPATGIDVRSPQVPGICFGAPHLLQSGAQDVRAVGIVMRGCFVAGELTGARR